MSRHGIEHARWDGAMEKLGFEWSDETASYLRRIKPGVGYLDQVLGGFDASQAGAKSLEADRGLWIARTLDGPQGLDWNDAGYLRFADPVTAAQYLLVERG